MDVVLSPRGHIWQCLETCFVVTTGKLLLASHGQKPGMLPTILQCLGQSPRTQTCPAQRTAAPGQGPGLDPQLLTV